MADKNEYRIVIGLNTNEIENDIDTLVFRHVDTFSWTVKQRVEITVIDSDDETIKAIVDDLFDHIVGSVSYVHAFHVIHDPDDDRWELVHERHRIERSRNDLRTNVETHPRVGSDVGLR